VVRFNATTLWHFDAAEWAPSTASKADLTLSAGDVGSYFNNGHGVRTSIVMERSLPAIIPRTDSFATFLISARTNYILYVSLSVRRLTLSYQLAN
jgi:hypothetical protein